VTPISSIPSSVLTLDTVVTAGGENFSQGQRQLICLARALLRESKLVILDEATASVDSETDALAQRAVRDSLQSATVLCIAHRLRTIADYDKVLVLEQGSVVEYGKPIDLIKKSNGQSLFKKMCEETGEYSDLIAIMEGRMSAV